MRIAAIDATNVPPVQRFAVDGLADSVVLAGRNGVGKTRLVQAIIQELRSPGSNNAIELHVEATSRAERDSWGKSLLNTAVPVDAQLLSTTFHANRRRINWQSSILQFESDRTIQRIQAYQFNWDVGDPWEEDIGWDQTFGYFRDRFQDTLHSIFRKVQSRRNKIAHTAEELIKRGERTMDLDFSDPLEPFKDAFTQLLAPKRLVDPDPKTQDLQYDHEDETRSINTLSSGEREVVNIVFDFLLRAPSHCIVFFDEPELHLHPELSYKLLQTLQNVAGRNQFVFCTHSPYIITASLDQSVIFIGPAQDDGANQALPVREDDETNEALKLLGQSVGIIALGKKLVLIEGQSASVDKQVYGTLLGDRFPNLVLVPSEGRDVISSFATIHEKVLSRTLWGVDFFMLCDRDAVPPVTDVGALETTTGGRLRVLPRYHLENYLLDADIICAVSRDLEPEDSWLRSTGDVAIALLDIARSRLSHTVALYVSSELRQAVGNVDLVPEECHDKNQDEIRQLLVDRANDELGRVGTTLDVGAVEQVVNTAWGQLEDSLGDGTWVRRFPGKQIFNIFAARTSLGAPRLKRAYLRMALSERPDVFDEVNEIFASFI